MRPELVQLVALCSHASPFLRGEVATAPELFPAHASFRGVQSVDFARPTSGQIGGMVMESVAPWLRRLAAEDVTALACSLRSYRYDKGDPAQPYGLFTDGDRGLEIWRPIWKRRSSIHDTEQRFVVVYESARVQRLAVPPRVSIGDARQGLLVAGQALLRRLTERAMVAQSVALEAWVRQCDHQGAAPSSDGTLRDSVPIDVVQLFDDARRALEIVDVAAWRQSSIFSDAQAAALFDQFWNAMLIALESVCAAA